MGMTMEPSLVVTACAEPETLPRLMGHLAQLGTVPRRMCADLTGGLLAITIVPAGLTARQIEIVAEKMRASVLVASVRIAWAEPQTASNEGPS